MFSYSGINGIYPDERQKADDLDYTLYAKVQVNHSDLLVVSLQLFGTVLKSRMCESSLDVIHHVNNLKT